MPRATLIGGAALAALLLGGAGASPLRTDALLASEPMRVSAPAHPTRTDVPARDTSAASGCVFRKAETPVTVAFCDTFDQPSATVTRSGELDQTIWGVSRVNTLVNPSQGQVNDFEATMLVGCGTPVPVLPPKDVRVCNGRVFESVNDGEGQSTLALYPKQPFDFAGRTGTVVFDANLDSQGPHAAWPEFWITDKPVPAPTDHRSANEAIARHAFGISFAAQCPRGYSGVDHISIVSNYRLKMDVPFRNGIRYTDASRGCFRSGTSTGALNHVEIRISPSHVEVWVSEPDSTTMLLAAAAEVAMPLTRGLVWLNDAHYNANKKPDTQRDHTFAWDNLGFDGPKTYRDLGFDAPDAMVPGRTPNSMRLGYHLTAQRPVTLRIGGVHRVQPPTGAIMTFNWFVTDRDAVPGFRINAGPWHETPYPFEPTERWVGWRTIDIPVPVSEVRDGANTVEFRWASGETVLSNVSIILIAGAPVP